MREAREDLAQIEKQYRDSTHFHLVKANLLDAEGNAALAISEYDLALKLSRTNVEAYVNRGAVYYRMGSYSEAKLDFESAITLDPAQPQALNNPRAHCLKKQTMVPSDRLFRSGAQPRPCGALFAQQ